MLQGLLPVVSGKEESRILVSGDRVVWRYSKYTGGRNSYGHSGCLPQPSNHGIRNLKTDRIYFLLEF